VTVAGGWSRRSFATVLALWVVGVGTVLVLGVQSAGLGQAFGSRDAVAEVRARWAALSGVEAAIAVLADDAQRPHPTDAFHVYDRLGEVARGAVGQRASWSVESWEGGERFEGPADAHARVHLAQMTDDDLFWLPRMTEDLIARIGDWQDEDDETSPLGAELGVYLSQPHPYEPRNGPLGTIEELELIASITPQDVRDEDWNRNGVLDPEEDDSELSWPPDDGDGELDAGWSGILTVSSAEPTWGLSGQPLIALGLGLGAGDLVSRVGIQADQAEVIAQFAATPDASLESLITTPLAALRGVDNQVIDPNAAPLTDEQLGLLLEEAAIDAPWLQPAGPARPGRVNINTVSRDVIQYVPGMTSTIADQLLRERDGRPLGFRTAADLLSIPGLARSRVEELVAQFGFRSAVFVVRSEGVDRASGARVEVVATLDRSRLPVTITDLRIR